MKCPFCSSLDAMVINSRGVDGESVIRRRRQCRECSKRFTTYERLEELPLYVVKSDKRRELFDRNKLREGVIRACEKRPVSTDRIEKLINEIEHELEDYVMEVPSSIIGEKVLKKLFEVDSVAYIRFASVYHQYDIDTFMKEIRYLKRQQLKQQLKVRGNEQKP
ncbi:MAG: transcriptional regulator NrdR [Elusimicrobia bacterium CG1_02_37_114]|nr:MAG: transcriptional regulator NrdR [Elusimicrobia bacterium CG1_02_37_114]PIV53080.1 MAG: transcriptional regulator NrdR [Elusimicrobia bacterium CG02_land_8_20_14_3_00_37_13]